MIIDEECPLVWCAELTEAKTEAQNVVAGRHVGDSDQSRAQGEIGKFAERAKDYVYRHFRAPLQIRLDGVVIPRGVHSGLLR